MHGQISYRRPGASFSLEEESSGNRGWIYECVQFRFAVNYQIWGLYGFSMLDDALIAGNDSLTLSLLRHDNTHRKLGILQSSERRFSQFKVRYPVESQRWELLERPPHPWHPDYQKALERNKAKSSAEK